MASLLSIGLSVLKVKPGGHWEPRKRRKAPRESEQQSQSRLQRAPDECFDSFDALYQRCRIDRELPEAELDQQVLEIFAKMRASS